MSNDPIGNEMLKSLELFVDGVEAHENLELVGEGVNGSGDTILIVEDNSVAEDVEGHQVTIELAEIFSAIKDEKSADRFVAVVAGQENPIKLNGVTRIVGYYSRTNNWNKSKIGELRDRAKGQYGTGKHVTRHKEETLAVIDNLS
jgi:hypothetical protein